MIAIITGSLVIVLAITIVRWVASVPLMQILSASIDSWANGVQSGRTPKPRARANAGLLVDHRCGP